MPAWSTRCPQGGYQEDGKPRPQEPRLPEVRRREATPPGSPQWGVWQVLFRCGDASGARVVLSRAVGWGEETGWSEPLPFLGSGAAPIKSEATEAGAPRTVALTEKSGPQPPGWFGSIEASGQGSRSSLGPGWWGSVQARGHQQQ